ncbi:MAG: hypothetical protein K7J46_03375 [Bryobacter sp.]|nr:hypothetical protein [Bryobacter sp. CoA8 C33]
MQRLITTLVVAACSLLAQPTVLPLTAIPTDAEGVARTVFRGQQPEEFPLRILGVLRNSGPGQNMILARLLTSRLEQTGVMQGMSGSPVYIGGKLIGAIAFAFPFAKEPIAGIRPIEEMLATAGVSGGMRARLGVHLGAGELPLPESRSRADLPQPVLTPISFSGLTPDTIAHFAPLWRRMGFVLQPAGGGAAAQSGASAPLQAGEMISVQLLRGDMNAGADGTVTYVEGSQVLAFGHRFLGGGPVEFPFARAEVITPMPNYQMPFKISQSLAPQGAIVYDGDAAVRGELGRKPRLAPLRIRYRDSAGEHEYQAEMVRHSLLSPLLLQMAVFSTLDHHFRSAGPGTVDLRATVRYPGQPEPLRVRSRYAGDNNLPLAASLGAAIPFSFFQQHSADELLPEEVTVELELRDGHEHWVIESITSSRRTARPGETIKIATHLASQDGRQQTLTHAFAVPAWVSPGETLTVTASDALTTNLVDFRSFYQAGGPVFRNPAELIATLGRLHAANALSLRAFRSSPGFHQAGQDLGNLPPSIAAALQRAPASYLPTYQSKLFDREFLLPAGIVNGSRTLSLEIEK